MKVILSRKGFDSGYRGMASPILPDFMRDIPMTYNADAWKDEGFVSAAKGQEFVFEANDDVIGWVKGMLLSGSR